MFIEYIEYNGSLGPARALVRVTPMFLSVSSYNAQENVQDLPVFHTGMSDLATMAARIDLVAYVIVAIRLCHIDADAVLIRDLERVACAFVRGVPASIRGFVRLVMPVQRVVFAQRRQRLMRGLVISPVLACFETGGGCSRCAYSCRGKEDGGEMHCGQTGKARMS